MISGPEGSYEEVCSFRWKPLESGKRVDYNIINKEDFLNYSLYIIATSLNSLKFFKIVILSSMTR